MSGAIGLHGGEEFTPGDEPFLSALLEAARAGARARAGQGEPGRAGRDIPLRVVVVPTATARHDPKATARHGREAIERVAAGAGVNVDVETALIVDPATAQDTGVATHLAAADLVYLPGGDPDLVPRILRDSLAWSSILAANARGAVVAGASAGAMALAPRTWTPNGWLDGLGLVSGLVVVPHFDKFDPRGWEGTVTALHDAGFGYLGIDERTGLLSDGAIGAARGWTVVGPGRVQWFPPRGEPVSAGAGGTIDLPA